MKRAIIRGWLQEIVDEYKCNPHEFWESSNFPITFERAFEGRQIQVEIDILESTPEYFHISFSANAGGLSAYFPIGTDIIVKKESMKDNTAK
jgi:hypothetical protein